LDKQKPPIVKRKDITPLSITILLEIVREVGDEIQKKNKD
jgi:hypothetical protein